MGAVMAEFMATVHSPVLVLVSLTVQHSASVSGTTSLGLFQAVAPLRQSPVCCKLCNSGEIFHRRMLVMYVTECEVAAEPPETVHPVAQTVLTEYAAGPATRARH